VKTHFFILFILLFIFHSGFTQDSDSSITSIDTLATDTNYTEVKQIVYHASADSSSIKERSFDKNKLDELKSDPSLNYKIAPTVAESLWERFLKWIGQIIETLFSKAVTTNWGRVIVYAIVLALVIFLIMTILKVNAFKIIYSGDGAKVKYNVLDENIHEMDFDKLIQDAIDQHDYRKAIRLVFLHSLKLLSDKQLIHFESGKTNHDYVAELNRDELKTGFNELSFYFDYAWYGNFQVNDETFLKIQIIFSEWKSKLSQK
jgi:hypothetical protein